MRKWVLVYLAIGAGIDGVSGAEKLVFIWLAQRLELELEQADCVPCSAGIE